MRPRSLNELYQTAARLWLTAALLAFLLPETARMGLWLPLHLTLAGAASVAICGAMQTFVLAMTATKAPPVWKPQIQFGLVNIGVAAVALGYPTGWTWLLVGGASVYLLSILLLGDIVWAAWRRALNRRHWLPISIYGAAVVSLLVGGVLGALVGSHALPDDWWANLRAAHLLLNVLGWISLTIAGTLITLLPTVLRVRMPVWRGRATAILLASGVGVLALGAALGDRIVLGTGGVLFAAGSVGIAWMAVRVLQVPRKWPVPLAAKHLLCALVWFVGGSLALAFQALKGPAALAAFRPVFLTVFVGGWIVQTLLGAWEFLLPMWKAGHPEERRRSWAAVELAWWAELAAMNAGLFVMTLRFSSPRSGVAGGVGVGLAVTGAVIALVKVWAFRQIGRGPVVTPRARAMWWADD